MQEKGCGRWTGNRKSIWSGLTSKLDRKKVYEDIFGIIIDNSTWRLSQVPPFYYPARACAARGYVIGRGVCVYLHFFFLSPNILTFYFNTGRLLIKFSGLWYSLAA